jgi:hypothetical protein
MDLSLENRAFTDFTDFYLYRFHGLLRDLLFERADTIVRLPGTGSAKTDHARKSELNESLRAALTVFADPRFLFHGC